VITGAGLRPTAKVVESPPDPTVGAPALYPTLGQLSVHPSSYRGGKKGDQLAEALGTLAHHGWVGKLAGRNVCEARAGLERES